MEQYESSAHGKSGECNRVFYMALPPSVYIDVAKNLRENCYSASGINRVIIEKPFGKDLESYRHLQSEISKLWKEEEVSSVKCNPRIQELPFIDQSTLV